MASPTSRRYTVAGALLLSLGLAACSSPTPNRPQDRAPDGASESGGAPSSGSGFRSDPISGGPEVWDDLYGSATDDPNAPYPPPAFVAEPTEGAYPPPRGGDAGAGDAPTGTEAAPADGDATAAPSEPTAAPTPG